jgi:hypothetical protein
MVVPMPGTCGRRVVGPGEGFLVAVWQLLFLIYSVSYGETSLLADSTSRPVGGVPAIF